MGFSRAQSNVRRVVITGCKLLLHAEAILAYRSQSKKGSCRYFVYPGRSKLFFDTRLSVSMSSIRLSRDV